MTRILASDSVCAPGAPRPGWIAVEDEQIVEVGEGEPPRHSEYVPGLLVPGFVDLQVNGHRDVDFATAPALDLERAVEALARAGTTTFLPTVVSQDRSRYDEILTRLAGLGDGIHLEGPFLGGAPGAHDAAHITTVDVDWLLDHVTRFPIRIVTLAPEADPGGHAIEALSTHGVVVALGHSTADYDAGRAAASAGARMVTHLFNAMSPLHHRAPGLVGAALDDPRLTATIIADLVHVHPAVLRIALRAKSAIALVSDAVSDEDQRGPNGTLAGSTITLAKAVANVIDLGIPVERAIAMATSIPAQVAGLRDRGRLAPGRRSDFVELDPDTKAVRRVWRAGQPLSSEI